MKGEDTLEGELINGKYRVLKRLGQGGMGMVYLANVEGPAGFEKLVALKVVHGHIAHDAQVVEMFLTEARLSAQLSHANLAQIYDLGDADGVYYIAMEYVRGRDLRGLMTAVDEREGRVPLPLCVFIVSKLCEGLDHAHALRDKNGNPLKLVHRDVTPVNCLLSFAGEVKVIDFGIAKAANVASRTRNGIIRGKLAYMSPEQTKGMQLDRRSDVFALGVILFELLIGGRPFDLDDDNELNIIERIRSGDHPRAAELDPEIPPALDRIVEKALAVERDDRYATAGAMQEDLQRFLMTEQLHVTARDLSSFVVEMIGVEAAKADGAGPAELSAQSSLKRKEDGTTALRARIITQPERSPVSAPTRENAAATRVGGQKTVVGGPGPTLVGAMPTDRDLPKVPMREESIPTVPPEGKTTVPSAKRLGPQGDPAPQATVRDRPAIRPNPFESEHLPTENVPSGVVRQLNAMRQSSVANPVATDPTRIATVPRASGPKRALGPPISEPGPTDPVVHTGTARVPWAAAVAAGLLVGAVGVAWLARELAAWPESTGDAGAFVVEPDFPRLPRTTRPGPAPGPTRPPDPDQPAHSMKPPEPVTPNEPVKPSVPVAQPIAPNPPNPGVPPDAGASLVALAELRPATRPDPRKPPPPVHEHPKAKVPEVKTEPTAPRSDPPPPVTATPPPMGFLTVKSAANPAEVFVDGRSIGMTPRLRSLVSPGKHELRVDCVYTWGRVRGVPKPLEVEVGYDYSATGDCVHQEPP